MPPKKTKSDNNDMCFYNHVPENFLDEVLPNPNIKNHNFTIPFRAVVVAPSGSGKTSFVANLINCSLLVKGHFQIFV